jgi:hypothetical protein
MIAEPKPTRPAKKKRRRQLWEEFVDYVVEIGGWDWVCVPKNLSGFIE